MNIFESAVGVAIKQNKVNWDSILDNAIKIRAFLDKYPAVTKYALSGKGNYRVKKLYESMVNK